MSKVWGGGGSLSNGTGEPINDATNQWTPHGCSVPMRASDSGHNTAPVIIDRVGGTISDIYTHARSNSWNASGSWQPRFRDHNGGSPTYQPTTITIADLATGARSDLATQIAKTAGQEYSWEWTRTGGSTGDLRIPFLSYAITPADGKSFQWNTFERPGLSTASATRHAPPVGDNIPSTEINSSRIKIKIDGSITHFGVRVFTNGRSTDTTFFLLLNGSPIGSGVTFAGGVTEFTEDAGFGTPVAITNGQYLSLRIVTGTGTGTIEWTCTPVTITPTANEFQCVVSSGNGLVVNQGVTTYVPIIGECERTTTTDGNAKIVVPFPMAWDRIGGYIRANSLAGAQTFTADIRVNGTPARTMQWAAGVIAEADASDLDPLSLDTGDEVDVRLVAAAGSGSAQFMNLTFRAVDMTRLAAVTGTLNGATEANVVAGGRTVVITLTGDTFIP